jgi:hypothetical protein
MLKFFGASVLTLTLLGCAGLSEGAMNAQPATYRAIGYAAWSIQSGSNAKQKQLMAIKAAKTEAMRDLAEKIHGALVSGRSIVVAHRGDSDFVQSSVEGLVRGARVVSIIPVAQDSYEVTLEVDAAEVEALRNMPPRTFR